MCPVRPLSYHVVCIGTGGIAIGHRPRFKHLPQLRDAGFTHVVTILSEKEGEAEIGDHARRNGLRWICLPWGKSVPPTKEETISQFRKQYEVLAEAFSSGAKAYVHCSAGIHRTGMFVFGLFHNFCRQGRQGTLSKKDKRGYYCLP